jgi:hypothetical protein
MIHLSNDETVNGSFTHPQDSLGYKVKSAWWDP